MVAASQHGLPERVQGGIVAVLVLVAVGCGSEPSSPRPPRPSPAAQTVEAAEPPTSLLLITLDTTRADHLSAYGYERPTTPTIERMAREGLRVTRAYTTMPTTDPAHLSILTGRYPRTHGTRRNGVPAVSGLDNLASWASANGRRTAAFVSRQHVRPSELGIAGFDHEDGPDVAQRQGAITLTRALAWLEEHAGEPYFVWVHFFDPHRPYVSPEPYARRFLPEGVTEVPQTQRTRGLTPDRVRLFTAQYDGEIAYADSLVERLWRAVRRPERQPLIVLTADHGEHLGELWERHRFSFGHGKFLYEGGVHVPMVLWWGDHLEAGGSVSGLVSLVDVPATIFTLLGEEGVPTQGLSFLDSGGRPRAGREHVFIERARLEERYRRRRHLPERQFSVRAADHCLIVSLPEERVELYETDADPLERVDVSASRPEAVIRLRRALDEWLEETPDARAAPLDPVRIEALRALGYIE